LRDVIDIRRVKPAIRPVRIDFDDVGGDFAGFAESFLQLAA
jgi:hypothetical protein